jgi:hypothetical protein
MPTNTVVCWQIVLHHRAHMVAALGSYVKDSPIEDNTFYNSTGDATLISS